MRFLPDSSGLVYLQYATPRQDFMLFDPDIKETRQLRAPNQDAGLVTSDITSDGKQIVFDRRREKSDVVLIELAAPR